MFRHDRPLTLDSTVLNSTHLPQRGEFVPIMSLCRILLHRVGVIEDAILEVCGCTDPRPFQIETIHHLAYGEDSSLVLIQRTENGKSLVPLTVTLLRCGITLILAPLHGLGSDKVDKTMVEEHGI